MRGHWWLGRRGIRVGRRLDTRRAPWNAARLAAVAAVVGVRVGRDTADRWLDSAAWKSVGWVLAGTGRRLPVRRSTPSYVPAAVRDRGMTRASAVSDSGVSAAFFRPGRVIAQATMAATTTGAR